MVMRTVGALAVLLLAACGGDDGSEAEVFSDAASLVAALNEAGIECSGYEAGDPSAAIFGTPPVETGHCTASDGSSLSIDVYEDGEHLDQAVDQAATVGCRLAEAFGISELNFMKGNGWSVSPEDNLDEDEVRSMAEAMNAEAVHVDC